MKGEDNQSDYIQFQHTGDNQDLWDQFQQWY